MHFNLTFPFTTYLKIFSLGYQWPPPPESNGHCPILIFLKFSIVFDIHQSFLLDIFYFLGFYDITFF